jgi:hypothetical protein
MGKAVREKLMSFSQVIEPGWRYDKDPLFHAYDRRRSVPGGQ